MIIGVDIGNYYIKNSEGIKFESRMKEDDSVLSGSAIKVEFKGKKYLIENGNFDININKIHKEDFLLSIATIVAMSTNSLDVQLGIGLPINFYKSYKDELIKTLKDNAEISVKVNNEDKRFIIDKVSIIPEAVGVYYSLSKEALSKFNNKELLIVDIGGKTTDTCIIDSNMTIKKPSTQHIGTLNLYNNISNLINSKYPELCVTTEDIKDVLDNGLYSFGNKINLDFVNYLFEDMAREIYNFIKLQYEDYQRKSIMLCGGGGIVLKSIFEKYIPNIIINDDIFANAKGFKVYMEKVGVKHA